MSESLAEKQAYIRNPEAAYADVVRRHLELYPDCDCQMRLAYRFTRVALDDLAPDCQLCGVKLEWGDGWYYEVGDANTLTEIFLFARRRYEEIGRKGYSSLCGCCSGRISTEFSAQLL